MVVAVCLCVALAGPPAEKSSVSPARRDNGILIHEVDSPFQAGKTLIRVLLPDRLEAGKKYPVIYVLPVEEGLKSRYGDGLAEVKKLDLANKLQVIFVAPTFSHLPWYADHPTQKGIRQESHLLRVVLPFIEEHYPVQTTIRGRLLLGFSKSGWGAWSLLLRHADLFGRAAAWDAPLMMARPNRFGMEEIFATQENFERYQVARLLRTSNVEAVGGRLILLGPGNFHDHHEEAHALLKSLRVNHLMWDSTPRRHDWHSGWVAEAAALLMLEN